jgi:hypothetical protein
MTPSPALSASELRADSGCAAAAGSAPSQVHAFKGSGFVWEGLRAWHHALKEGLPEAVGVSHVHGVRRASLKEPLGTHRVL